MENDAGTQRISASVSSDSSSSISTQFFFGQISTAQQYLWLSFDERLICFSCKCASITVISITLTALKLLAFKSTREAKKKI